MRIEPVRMLERGHRRFEQPTVAACLQEPCEQFRIARVIVRAANEPQHRPLRLSELDLEVGVQIVRKWEIRVQTERAGERGPSLLDAVTLDRTTSESRIERELVI